MFLVYAWIIDFPVSAQFRFVMPWQFLAWWGSWSCRNCSEDWPLLQKVLYVKGNHYCPPVSVLCSWISQTSAHLIWYQNWPGLSNRRGTINKIYSWTQPKEVSLLKDLRFHDTLIHSYLQRRWGHQAWVLCWWHWPPDPSLCQPSSHWQLTYHHSFLLMKSLVTVNMK